MNTSAHLRGTSRSQIIWAIGGYGFRSRNRSHCSEAVGGDGPLGVVASYRSTALGCAPPILSRSNYWDLVDAVQIEQITIDADQKRALATDCGAQDGNARYAAVSEKSGDGFPAAGRCTLLQRDIETWNRGKHSGVTD